MNESELKLTIDALSMRSKRWLHDVCHQIADGDGYINIPECRVECAKAGILIYTECGYITMADGVMELVYSDGYLAKAVTHEIVPSVEILRAMRNKLKEHPIR